jgi:5'-deoxynucleotidase YfbR-like HD superfamily hydrolase
MKTETYCKDLIFPTK